MLGCGLISIIWSLIPTVVMLKILTEKNIPLRFFSPMSSVTSCCCPCQDNSIGMPTLHIGPAVSEKTGTVNKGFSFIVMGDGGFPSDSASPIGKRYTIYR